MRLFLNVKIHICFQDGALLIISVCESIKGIKAVSAQYQIQSGVSGQRLLISGAISDYYQCVTLSFQYLENSVIMLFDVSLGWNARKEYLCKHDKWGLYPQTDYIQKHIYPKHCITTAAQIVCHLW